MFSGKFHIGSAMLTPATWQFTNLHNRKKNRVLHSLYLYLAHCYSDITLLVPKKVLHKLCGAPRTASRRYNIPAVLDYRSHLCLFFVD